MKLKVGERRHLLTKILDSSNGIEAVQGALQGEVSVDSIQHLGPRVDYVEALSPVKGRDVRRHFAKRVGQALAALVSDRRGFFGAFLHGLIRHGHPL